MSIVVAVTALRRAVVGLTLAVVALLAFGVAAPEARAAAVKIAVGGSSCICYLPTILTEQLGYYKEAGVDVELIDFKGGSTALTAVLGGSADVVSGFYDHTVELAAKKPMQSIVIFDKLPGLVLMISPKSNESVKTIADLVGKTVGVSAPGSSTDFYLKYLLRKNGIDPNKVAVVGIGNGATSVAAMEQNQVQAAVMVEPAATQMSARHADQRILCTPRARSMCSPPGSRRTRSNRRNSPRRWCARCNGYTAIAPKRSWPRCRKSSPPPIRRST